MAKKNKKNKTRSNIRYSATELAERLRKALSEQRTQLAYSTAKELLSHDNLSAAQHELACKALELKIVHMHRQGEHEQIITMFDSFRKKSSELDELVAPEVKILIEWYGYGKNVFEHYDDNASVKNALDLYISNIMIDPTELTECSMLPNSHVLKHTATLLLAAWEKLERGENSNPEFNELTVTVGRHSPFIAWRLFISGLNFLYQGDQDQATANFTRIAVSSPLHPVASALIRIISGSQPGNQLQTSIAAVISKCDINTLSAEIEALLSVPNPSLNKVYDTLTSLFTRNFYHNKPVLYLNMLALCLLKYDSNSFGCLIERLKQYNLPGLRHALLICDYITKQANYDLWQNFWDTEPLTPMKKSFLCDWLAVILSNRLHTDTSSDMFSARDVDMKFGQELYNTQLLPLWEMGQQAYPLVESYAKWHSIAEFYCTPAQADKILLDWNRDFPDDEEVLYKLVESCRARKAFSKAENYLLRLDELVAGQPRLEQLKQFVMMEKAVKYLGAGKPQKAHDCIKGVKTQDGTVAGTLNRCIKYIIACAECDPRAENILLEHKYPVLNAFILNRLRQDKIRFNAGIIEQMKLLSEEAELFVHDIDTLFSFKDGIWDGNDLSAVIVPDQLKHIEQVSSERMWNVCRHYIRLCGSYNFGSRILDILWSITGEGIKRRDKYMAKFLLLRGAICFWIKEYINYRSISLIHKKGVAALALAEKIAQKKGDQETSRYLDEFIYRLSLRRNEIEIKEETLSRAKAEKIIESEINSNFSSFINRSRIISDVKKAEIKRPPELISGWDIYYDEDGEDDDWDDEEFEPPPMERILSEFDSIFNKMKKECPHLSDDEIKELMFINIMGSLDETMDKKGNH